MLCVSEAYMVGSFIYVIKRKMSFIRPFHYFIENFKEP